MTDPRTPRITPRASSDKRTAILAAARRLVSRGGFRDTQMTAVAAEAEVALATLYRYFPSKSALMVELVNLVAQREVNTAAGFVHAEGPAIDRLSQAAWSFARRALQGRRLAHALVAEPVEPEIEAARLLHRRKLAGVFEVIVDQGLKASELPAQDGSVAAACIVGSLFEGLVGSLMIDPAQPEDDRHRQAVAIIGFCMRAVSGRDVTFDPADAGTGPDATVL